MKNHIEVESYEEVSDFGLLFISICLVRVIILYSILYLILPTPYGFIPSLSIVFLQLVQFKK